MISKLIPLLTVVASLVLAPRGRDQVHRRSPWQVRPAARKGDVRCPSGGDDRCLREQWERV